MHRLTGQPFLRLCRIDGYHGKLNRDLPDHKLILRRCAWRVAVDCKSPQHFSRTVDGWHGPAGPQAARQSQIAEGKPVWMGCNIADDDGPAQKHSRPARANIRPDFKPDQRFVVMGGQAGGDGFADFFPAWIKDQHRASCTGNLLFHKPAKHGERLF
ncbi:hypothetical protein C067_02402 [Brucella sp. F8/99]|nr:hypothetical protein C067_02402 [Brucella sp. F8/99]